MRILAAIDQSPYAEKVLDRAIDLAKREEAELLIMTVVEPLLTYGAFQDAPYVFEEFQESAARAVEQAERKAREQGLHPKVDVLEGTSVPSRIIQHADQHGVDLIVMGHKGRSAVEQFLVGSVASKVVTYAPCSVLVVR